MLGDQGCHVWHAAIADLDVVAVTYFSQPVSVGKCLSKNFKKLRPMFVVTCSLNEGLNRSILRLKGFFLLSMALKLMAPEKPLLSRAF